MYRKLDEESINRLLETGIEEFAEHGLDRTNINVVAKKAGVSVGVLYKYYEDKDNFFLACVRHSLKLLDQTMQEAIHSEEELSVSIRNLIHALMQQAEEHRNYYVMYNEITSGSCKKYAGQLAEEIEGRTSKLYASLLEKAQREGKLDKKADPGIFAFFFDNLLMMLQFSFSCEYYQQRMKLFCGEEIQEQREKMAEQFMDFITGALGIRE